MKRKEYQNISERKADNRAGFLTFPVVNLILWVVYSFLQTWYETNYPTRRGEVSAIQQLILLLPWVVNGLILIWHFILRPEFAVGYLVFIAFALVFVFALGILFLGGCFLAIGAGFIFSSSDSLAILALSLVLFTTLIAGLIWIGSFAKNWYDEWLYVPVEKKGAIEEPTQPNEGESDET